MEYAIKLDFPTTNNEAEYEALIVGLGLERTLRVKNLKVCGDSKLVVFQVNGEFEAREESMSIILEIFEDSDSAIRRVSGRVYTKGRKYNALSQFASSGNEVCS